MGNILLKKKKKLSKILELEGWKLLNNKKEVYYNMYTKELTNNYPERISNYEDIYDFYNNDFLNIYETIDLLNLELKNERNILMEEDINKIDKLIKKICKENELDDENVILNLCFG